MPRLLFVAFIALTITACSPMPSTEALVARFNGSPEAFQTLRQMIEHDAGSSQCLVVGTDHIGDYWAYDGRWSSSSGGEKTLLLGEVLKTVGISRERYREYLRHLAVTGSERVSYCRNEKSESWGGILMFRAGLAVSGCSADASWGPRIPASDGKRGGGDFAEITPLQGDWYLEVSCT